jgi:plastocyanin
MDAVDGYPDPLLHKGGAVVKFRIPSITLLWFFCLAALCVPAQAQTVTVTGVVEVTKSGSQKTPPSSADVAVWLTPVADGHSTSTTAVSLPKRKFTLVQKNKTFEPHVLVLPIGSAVDFPNKDPFFHNVFSLYDGKRFDLGLYEAGASRALRFDRPGISFLFCNIHSEMSAVVIALDTPYYGVSNRLGKITIADVPPGKYVLHVWREGSPPEALKALSKQIVVSDDSSSLGKLAVPDNAVLPVAHKNKYGKDYENPTPAGTVYNQP